MNPSLWFRKPAPSNPRTVSGQGSGGFAVPVALALLLWFHNPARGRGVEGVLQGSKAEQGVPSGLGPDPLPVSPEKCLPKLVSSFLRSER